MKKLASISLFVLAFSACAAQHDEAGPGPGSQKESLEIDCPDGYLPWWDDDGNEICAELGEGDGDIDTDDPSQVPAPPAPTESVRFCLQPTPVPVPAPGIDVVRAPIAAAVAPACPPDLYLTQLKKFSGPLLVGGQLFGQHSSTRLTRWKATWDATLGRYVVQFDNTIDHGNHGAPPANAKMRRYAIVNSPWTPKGGVGDTSFNMTSNVYCPCAVNVGHVTAKDSCYGFFPNDHVCHSDTRYQERVFRQITGVGPVPANQCGTGLWTRFAP